MGRLVPLNTVTDSLGFPWIDAIMRQLKQEGWIHHLARHSVACFLTRGDLFISWERGAEVFEEYLIDHDSALNIGNWLWLRFDYLKLLNISASAYFTTYFRVYSPIVFGKQYDKEGKYIKKVRNPDLHNIQYVPELKNMPVKYIFEPWTAPKAVQEQSGCIIGKNYPKPIVDHAVVSKENMAKMKSCYQRGQKGTVRLNSFQGPMATEFLGSWKNLKSSVPQKRKAE